MTSKTLIFVMLLAISQLVYSNSDSLSDKSSGKWELQFGIASNFTLKSFNGSSLSASYQIDEKTKFRFGVTQSSDFSDNNQYESNKYTDTIYSITDGSYNNDRISLTLPLILIKELSKSDKLAGYYGYGTYIGYDYLKGAHKYTYTNVYGNNIYDEQEEYSYTETTYTVGLTVLIGCKYLITERIYLSAEYSLSAEYYNVTFEQKQPSLKKNQAEEIHNKTSKGFKTKANDILFGITLKF